MAKSLKEAGIRELEAFERRARRQFGLGRISSIDFTILERKVQDLKRQINNMEEVGVNGEAKVDSTAR